MISLIIFPLETSIYSGSSMIFLVIDLSKPLFIVDFTSYRLIETSIL